MHEFLKKIITLSLISFLFASSVNATEKNDEPYSDLVYTLKRSADALYLSTNGRDFPPHQSALKNCIADEDYSCIRAYNSVMLAKATIKSLPSEQALLNTLKLINNECSALNEKPERTCIGSIISLYFYDSPKQDLMILEQVKKYPENVKELIFNNHFLWFHNRHHPDLWVEYLKNKSYAEDAAKYFYQPVRKESWILTTPD